LRTVAPRRAEIAAYIRKVVDNWDETLVKRTELPAGRDGNIRINGTLVRRPRRAHHLQRGALVRRNGLV